MPIRRLTSSRSIHARGLGFSGVSGVLLDINIQGCAWSVIPWSSLTAVSGFWSGKYSAWNRTVCELFVSTRFPIWWPDVVCFAIVVCVDRRQFFDGRRHVQISAIRECVEFCHFFQSEMTPQTGNSRVLLAYVISRRLHTQDHSAKSKLAACHWMQIDHFRWKKSTARTVSITRQCRVANGQNWSTNWSSATLREDKCHIKLWKSISMLTYLTSGLTNTYSLINPS